MSGVHAGAAHPAATRTAPAIVLENVSKTYAGGVHALDDVSLAVEHGTFLAVMGPSGSGKSTLMHCAAGLDSPTSGSIRIGGQEIAGLNETRRTELRREHIGFVFQSYNLVPALSIADNITLPLRLAGRAPTGSGCARWSTGSVSATASRTGPPSSPAASSNGPRSYGRWWPNRPSCSPTSRPERWICAAPTRCSACCANSSTNCARRW